MSRDRTELSQNIVISAYDSVLFFLLIYATVKIEAQT